MRRRDRLKTTQLPQVPGTCKRETARLEAGGGGDGRGAESTKRRRGDRRRPRSRHEGAREGSSTA
uniref:Uncharacterized protein MANES_10G075200 n=1 Tax=Rhizophora mucronata TaxID=61149 RepID=A0A2P2QRD8_RHIMU